MARVLITEPLAPSANAALVAAGHDVVERLGLSPAQLLDEVKGAQALIVRSATKVTAEVFAAADELIVVGRAGVGVDNIDLAAATANGVMVANAPFSIGVSTAEHAMALLLALARNVPQAHGALVEGRWEKSKWEGVELHGKVLGLLGLGRIGSLVAQRANAFGMRVVAWDVIPAPERAKQMGVELFEDLDDMVPLVDFLSVHLLKTKESVGLINATLMAKMKRTVRIINGARGGIVDEAALADALRDGRVGGAALDVFAEEPLTESPLFGLPNVVVTPHVGASTAEAQDKAGVQVAEQVVLALAGEFVPHAMNVNAAAAAELVRPFVGLAERLGGLLAGLVGEPPSLFEVEYCGPLAESDVSLATLSALRGLLNAVVDESVSFVNAPQLAKKRGLDVKEVKFSAEETAASITLRAGDRSVTGTLAGLAGEARITAIDGINCEVPPAKHLFVVRNDDRVGMLALVTAAMRDANINVSNMHLGRSSDGSAALMVLATDAAVPAEAVESLRSEPGILDARAVTA
ncbi:MAG TPA: phosphoglycerate dehydrogenase [Acidimicrobiales bacterium]|nr:phosphoglycerate dehydrogenase [Acidimicrobiales bacterium]